MKGGGHGTRARGRRAVVQRSAGKSNYGEGKSSPAPLIETVDSEVVGRRGECRKEIVVAIYMVIKAMDEDDFCAGFAIGLVPMLSAMLCLRRGA